MTLSISLVLCAAPRTEPRPVLYAKLQFRPWCVCVGMVWRSEDNFVIQAQVSRNKCPLPAEPLSCPLSYIFYLENLVGHILKGCAALTCIVLGIH